MNKITEIEVAQGTAAAALLASIDAKAAARSVRELTNSYARLTERHEALQEAAQAVLLAVTKDNLQRLAALVDA